MVGARGLLRDCLAIGAASLAFAVPARAEDIVCPPVWPPRAPASSVSLADPAALLALRDISQPGPGANGTSPLAVSPDGKRIAFFIAQPVPAVNDLCETLVVLDLAAPRDVRILDSGGSGIRYEEVLRGVRRPSGTFEVNSPVWSPDGRALVYRKRVDGEVQAWRAALDTGSARQLSHAEQDVEAVSWSRDGERVLYTVRPGRAAFFAAREREAAKGYLYDARFLPSLAAEPQLPAELPEALMSLPAEGGPATPAAEADKAAFAPPSQWTYEIHAVERPDGVRAGADPVDETFLSRSTVWVERAPGERTKCADPACTGALRGLWWQGDEVMFLKRDGWLREDSVIQAWSPQSGTVRTLMRVNERVSGCVPTRDQLLCLSEGSRRPRRVIAVDPASGRMSEFFDPNPEVDTASLPPVERLRWTNEMGHDAWADLVLPSGSPPRGGWPMVIVQYRSDGFLKGGTGDEYPIYPLVARGMAVFSFHAPDSIGFHTANGADMAAMAAAGHRNWARRRSVHDSLMRGLDLALARGTIDPSRIGISGLSDGSTTTRFALINENRFAAASISTCCLEPFTIMALGGPAQAEWFRLMGYPDASRPDDDFWRPASMALNAGKMRTPLLMQLSDDEFIDSLETFTALREHDKPVELYVFRGEHHIKWQPVHRLAIYERNLDWFAFWLQDRVDPDPAKAEQYARWEAMKRSLREGGSGP
jgi:hypothetical protein